MPADDVISMSPTRRERIAAFFGLERNIVASSSAFLLICFGEELWKRFLPKYLESLGAGPMAIGWFGTTRDFFDAIYQYPGGWMADRFGRRAAFLIFIVIAFVGYLIYWASPSWEYVFLGLALSMAWASMASPAIFAVIGDSLPRERRAMGFTVQAILKRVPMTIAPLVGGALIAAYGILGGVRTGLIITLGLCAAAIFVVLTIKIPVVKGEATNVRGVWRSFHFALKRLLVSDVIIRLCEGMADVFIVLYATNILGISLPQYGILVAVQMVTSMVVYVPAAKIAGHIGKKPFVIATFLCFALFPVAVVLSTGFSGLLIAFVIGGLREIGEPSRKAMIVDFAEPALRARTVGLYYLIRSLSVTPAAVAGGALWKIAPTTPFITAGLIGLLGTVVFALTVDEQHAS